MQRDYLNNKQEVTTTFAADALAAFVYPLQGFGVFILLLGGIFLGSIGRLGIGSILIGGYFVLFWSEIIVRTASGIDKLPSIPSASDIWDDLVKPYFAGLSTIFLCFLPAVLVAKQFGGSTILILTIVVCMFYLPMAWLAVVMHQNIAAINPVLVIRAISRAFAPYLLACIFFLLALGVSVGLMLLIDRNKAPFVAIYFSNVFGMYFMVIVMRVLGLLYRHNQVRLGWFQS